MNLRIDIPMSEAPRLSAAFFLARDNGRAKAREGAQIDIRIRFTLPERESDEGSLAARLR